MQPRREIIVNALSLAIEVKCANQSVYLLVDHQRKYQHIFGKRASDLHCDTLSRRELGSSFA